MNLARDRQARSTWGLAQQLKWVEAKTNFLQILNGLKLVTAITLGGAAVRLLLRGQNTLRGRLGSVMRDVMRRFSAVARVENAPYQVTELGPSKRQCPPRLDPF